MNSARCPALRFATAGQLRLRTHVMRNQPSQTLWHQSRERIGDNSPGVYKFFYRLLIPIWTDVGDAKMNMTGSAVAMAHNDDLYVITARHVLDQSPQPRLQFGKTLSRLEGEALFPFIETPDRKIRLDIALIKPIPRLADKIKAEKIIIASSQLGYPKDPLSTSFFIAGCITSKSKHVPSSNLLRTHVMVHALTVTPTNDNQLGLLLPFKRPDGTDLPSPHGLSGAPILFMAGNDLLIAGFNTMGIPISDEGYVLGYQSAPVIASFLSRDG